MGWFVFLDVKRSRVNLVLGAQLLQVVYLVVLKQGDHHSPRLRQRGRVGVLYGERSWWDSRVSLAMEAVEKQVTSNIMCR